MAAVVISTLADAAKLTAFETVCKTDHGIVLYESNRDAVCVRGVIVYRNEDDDE